MNVEKAKLACASTVVVELSPDQVSIQRRAEHQAAVDALAQTAGGHPLCRQR